MSSGTIPATLDKTPATLVQGSEKKAPSKCHVTTLSGVEARISLEGTARPPLARLSRRTAQVGFS